MARLGDICEVLNGYAFKSEKYISSGIRIIRISNVQKGYIEDTAPAFYPIDTPDIEKYTLYEDDLLISLTGNVGRVALLKKDFLPAALNQRVACLRIKDGVPYDKSFLYCFLNSDYFENKCIQSAKGVAQKNMSTEWLKDYEIPDLNLEEQREIATVLNKISELITARIQQLSAFDELVKARFVEMFGDEQNPYKWEVVTVEEVADVQVGVVIKPAQYYTDKEHGVKTFRSLNIGPMYIKDTDWVYFTEEGNKKNSKSILKENDLLIVRSGAPGTACVVTSEYVGCNAVDIIIAHPNLKKVNPYYLCQYTNLPHGKKQIDVGIGGVAQQHFNVGKYNKVNLMLPPIDLQNEFELFIKQIDKSKFAVQQSLDKLETLKKALMQKYFG